MCSESFRGSPSENLDLGTCADRSMKHPLSITRAQLSSTEKPTEERAYQVLCPRHGLHKETTWLLSCFTLVQNLCAGASAELSCCYRFASQDSITLLFLREFWVLHGEDGPVFFLTSVSWAPYVVRLHVAIRPCLLFCRAGA